MILIADNVTNFRYRMFVFIQQQLGGIDAPVDTVLQYRRAEHGLEAAFELRFRDAQLPRQGRQRGRVGVFPVEYGSRIAYLCLTWNVDVFRMRVDQRLIIFQYLQADAQ